MATSVCRRAVYNVETRRSHQIMWKYFLYVRYGICKQRKTSLLNHWFNQPSQMLLVTSYVGPYVLSFWSLFRRLVETMSASVCFFCCHLISESLRGVRPSLKWRIFVIVVAYLFTKLPWPGDSEVSFWSSSQASTCLPHAIGTSQSPCLSKKVKKESCEYDFFWGV